MSRVLLVIVVVGLICTPCFGAEEISAKTEKMPRSAPVENPYDVIGKMFRPLIGALLGGKDVNTRAAIMRITFSQISGKLPPEMEGASVMGAVEFPDKVKLAAPALGETITVCRNGKKVWAVPGKKAQFLLDKFPVKPEGKVESVTPIYLPIAASQAVFLPAVFSVVEPEKIKMTKIDDEEYREITAKLMPALAKAVKGEDFEVTACIGADYAPRRFIIKQKSFSLQADFSGVRFLSALPDSTWEEPAGVSDVLQANSDMLDALLFVVMNSIKLEEMNFLPPRRDDEMTR